MKTSCLNLNSEVEVFRVVGEERGETTLLFGQGKADFLKGGEIAARIEKRVAWA